MKKILLCALCVFELLLSQSSEAQTKASSTAKPEPTGPTVEMEPYVVRDSRVLPSPEQWYYAKVPTLVLTRGDRTVVAPGYEMLANLTANQTKVLVDELQLRQFAATYLWPMLTHTLPRTPIYTVVDTNLQQSAMRPIVTMIDGWNGEPIVVKDVQPSPSNFNSFHSFADISGQNVAGRAFAAEYGLSAMGDMNPDMDDGADENEESVPENKTVLRTKELDDQSVIKPLPDGFVELAINGGPLAALVRAGEPKASVTRPSEEQLAATLSYELNLFALNSMSQKIPHWFARGLGNLLGCTQVSHTQIQFALVRENLSGQNMSKLSALLLKKDAFTRDESLMASIFVHYGLYGDNGKYASRFMQFIERIGQGALPDEAMFKEVFGVSMSRMENELATYARTFAAFKSTNIKGTLPQMPACIIREATQSEVARIKSEVYISQTNPAKALDELRIAYWRGEREPSMLAALALVEQQIGSEARARKLVKALQELPKAPPQTYVVAARLQLKDMLAAKSDGAKLTGGEMSELLDVLGNAIAAGNTTEDVCTTLAEIVLKSSMRPNAGLRAFLQQATRRYPQNKSIREALRVGEA